ncbi:MAG: serine phosphatase [Proteobacteria bacterium]|jgi:sigma-B regulation protein RsbU (phosphoserine phosphatase)|nr:serine phosphatase [Pseudomonadota bacterium]
MPENEAIRRHLRNSVFLSAASEETIQELSARVECIDAKAGDRIFSKGETGSAIYFVVEGSMRIHDDDIVLTHRGAGEAFGEIGALASLTRTASVTAEIDSQLLKLDKEVLFDTMARRPEAAYSFIEALCHRESALVHDATERAIKAKVTERELAIAQKIQRSFLPDVVPNVPGWKLAGFLQPAREVAGDFYDFFVIPKLGCVGLVIGDVCDKGVGSALFMTLFRSLIRSTSMYRDFVGDDHHSDDVTKILRHSIKLTNEYIATTHGESSMFASVFYGLLIPETGQLCYINAGHEAPLIVGTNGIRTKLEPTGPVIGLFPDIVHEVKIIDMLPNEVLVAYTDGATDAKNSAGEQFSEDNLLALVAEGAPTANAMVHKIVSSLEAFIGEAEQYDDITVIAASRGSME